MAKTVTLGSANPLPVTNLGGGGTKIAFIYLEDGMTATFGSANPLTVTNLGEGHKNCLYLPERRQG